MARLFFFSPLFFIGLGGLAPDATAQPLTDRDYYKILGVSPDATEQQIKSAYRRGAMKYHPDRNPGDNKAEEEFKKLTEAYHVLSHRNSSATQPEVPPPTPAETPKTNGKTAPVVDFENRGSDQIQGGADRSNFQSNSRYAYKFANEPPSEGGLGWDASASTRFALRFRGGNSDDQKNWIQKHTQANIVANFFKFTIEKQAYISRNAAVYFVRDSNGKSIFLKISRRFVTTDFSLWPKHAEPQAYSILEEWDPSWETSPEVGCIADYLRDRM
jgi:hypothetical protein